MLGYQNKKYFGAKVLRIYWTDLKMDVEYVIDVDGVKGVELN